VDDLSTRHKVDRDGTAAREDQTESPQTLHCRDRLELDSLAFLAVNQTGYDERRPHKGQYAIA